MRRTIFAAALALAACGSPSPADISKDVATIEAQMHSRFDQPDMKLDAGPVVVSGDHAVADWTQGSRGGRALFERREGNWALVLCSGDALREAEFLKQARVPERDADALESLLADAEKHVPAARLAAMSSFMGTVTADQMTPGSK